MPRRGHTQLSQYAHVGKAGTLYLVAFVVPNASDKICKILLKHLGWLPFLSPHTGLKSCNITENCFIYGIFQTKVDPPPLTFKMAAYTSYESWVMFLGKAVFELAREGWLSRHKQGWIKSLSKASSLQEKRFHQNEDKGILSQILNRKNLSQKKLRPVICFQCSSFRFPKRNQPFSSFKKQNRSIFWILIIFKFNFSFTMIWILWISRKYN